MLFYQQPTYFRHICWHWKSICP